MSLSLSSAYVLPGGTASLALTLASPAGSEPAGVQWTLTYPSSAIVSIAAIEGTASTAAGKSLSCAGVSGSYTCLATGINTNVFPNGVVATVTVSLSTSASGALPIGITNALGASLPGDAIAVTATGGTLSVLQPATVSSLSCTPASIQAPGASTCTVSLSAAAPSGGATVSLASDNANLSAPASVTVPAASSSASFTVNAAAVTTDQTAALTATLNSSSKTASVSLLSPAVVSSLQCSPASLASGSGSSCTVTLSKAAPSGGSTVSITSSNAEITVPSSVTVAAAASTAGFTATAGAAAADQAVTITAALNGSSRTASLTVLAPASVSSLTCAPASIPAPGASTCTVSLSAAAPSGGATVSLSSDNTNLTASASVTVPAASSSASFTVNAAAVTTDQTVVLTATLNGASKSASVSLLAPAVVSSLHCSPASLASGSGSNCTVTLSKAAPSGGSTVSITSSNAVLTVPSSVTVAAATSTASFTATAGTAADQAVTVTAALNGSSKTASLTILAPTAVSSITCVPDSIQTPGLSTCTISLSAAAPAGGATVSLSSANANLTAPASVTVPADSSSASFTVNASAVTADQTAAVTATLNGSSQTASISLLAPAVVSSLQCSPTSLASGSGSNCTVVLSKAAPSGGSAVSVGSSHAVVSVPASVTVAAGATNASFTAAAGMTASDQAVTVAAALNGGSKAASLMVLAPISVSSLACTPASVAAPGASTCTVSLSAATPSSGATVSLASDNANLTAPASVTVPAPSTSASFTVNAAAVTTDQTATLTATLNGASKTASLQLLASNVLSSLQCSPVSLAWGATAACTVAVTRPASAAGITVAISGNLKALTFPDLVAIAPGQTTVRFNATVRNGFTGSATLSASHNGITKDVVLTIVKKDAGNPARISSLSCVPAPVEAGDKFTCEVHVETNEAEPVALAITTSSADMAAPSEVATRAGQTTLAFEVSTNPAAPEQTGVVEANLTGHTARAHVLITAGKDPVIRVPERQLTKWGAPIRFIVAASSVGRSPVRLSASALPAGAAFDAATGLFSWTAAESQQGSHRITFAATDSAGASSVAQTIVEVDAGKPAALALMNAASRANDLACSPGSLAVITGKWLTESAPASDSSGSEHELAGSRVKINGHYARLVSVSPTEVQFVCPSLLAETPVEILVETRSGATEPLRSVMRAATPGIFSVDGSGRGPAAATIDATPAFAAVRSARSNGQPAQPGDRLLIRATGLGSERAPSYPLVQLGDLYVEVESIAPYPGHAGVIAIQVRVPAGTNVGNDTPVRLHLPQPGRSPIESNTVTVAIEAVRR